MGLRRIIKLWLFRSRYIFKKVTISNGCDIALHSTFEGCNAIGKNTFFSGKLGFGSYIAENSIVLGHIGRFCSIAADVKVLSGTHPLTIFVSTSPVFYSLLKQNNISFVKEQHFEEFLYADKTNRFTILVGNDVWIGNSAIINGGITIGDGAVILANATVTKNVPPYAVVGGVPATIIKTRFDDDTISYLTMFKWWNQPIEWLIKNAPYFQNINLFKEKFHNKSLPL